MRQRRWIKLLSDYDFVIRYHPGKANVVADALSRKDKEPIQVRALVVTVHNNLPRQIQNAQVEACKEKNISAEGFLGKGEPFEVRSDGTKCLKGRARGARFGLFWTETLVPASRFWRSLQKSLGTNLDMSSAYHPETDSQSERTIQTLEDMLRACMIDFDLIIPLDEVRIDEKLHFIEEPIEIMDKEVKQLKQIRIPIVKVRWNSSREPEYTWEREDQMWKKYHLFDFNKKAGDKMN
ncbi:putative reverse transcriptase domain-containing protein [Tanacetum coccineum]